MKKLETQSTVLLKHHLKALKLPTMTAELAKVLRQTARLKDVAAALRVAETRAELKTTRARLTRSAARFSALETRCAAEVSRKAGQACQSGQPASATLAARLDSRGGVVYNPQGWTGWANDCGDRQEDSGLRRDTGSSR